MLEVPSLATTMSTRPSRVTSATATSVVALSVAGAIPAVPMGVGVASEKSPSPGLR